MTLQAKWEALAGLILHQLFEMRWDVESHYEFVD